MGVMGGEEREQEIKNVFAKIMAENFPNLVKKKNGHTSPQSRESLTRLTQRGPHQETQELK